MLPCEFCEELLPSSHLTFHQVSYAIYCVNCEESVCLTKIWFVCYALLNHGT